MQCGMPTVHGWQWKGQKSFSLSLHDTATDELKKELRGWLREVESDTVRVSKITVTGPAGKPACWGECLG